MMRWVYGTEEFTPETDEFSSAKRIIPNVVQLICLTKVSTWKRCRWEKKNTLRFRRESETQS